MTPRTDSPTSFTSLSHRHILLGLSGGIACYKSADFCRRLIKAGATVQVVMTDAAQQFITPVTMQALSGRPVFTSQWDGRDAAGLANAMPHINLSREAAAIVIAPASADMLRKLAHGAADDLLSLLCLARPAATVPLIVAPAMNREMWQHPATQRHVAQLRADGVTVLDVGQGEQACGEVGDGRMLEPEELLYDLECTLAPKPLRGQRVLVSAGPTYEAIDPVRGITNLSSGKMGFAIARAAHEAGAEVTLVAGPVALPTPRGVRRIDVKSALNMKLVLKQEAKAATIFISSAAVADWRPANAATQKIKKDGSGDVPSLSFVENPDILAGIAASERAQQRQLFCVGFAAESHDLMAHAQAKRTRKNVPLLVGNIGPATFGQDDNALLLVDATTTQELPHATKLTLARQLVHEIATRMARWQAEA
jgi:phosphopantothenoylcysteine decarboxylase/phosphopantothenate--cysteine ligase